MSNKYGPKFYVTYYTSRYDDPMSVEFDTLEQVLQFLNRHATNPDFEFTVIEGQRVEFEPAETVKCFRKKGDW